MSTLSNKGESNPAGGDSADMFGKPSSYATSSMEDITLDVDPAIIDESNLIFKFKMLKDQRDAKRARSGVLAFIDSVAEASGISSVSSNMDMGPSRKLKELFQTTFHHNIYKVPGTNA